MDCNKVISDLNDLRAQFASGTTVIPNPNYNPAMQWLNPQPATITVSNNPNANPAAVAKIDSLLAQTAGNCGCGVSPTTGATTNVTDLGNGWLNGLTNTGSTSGGGNNNNQWWNWIGGKRRG